MPERFTEPSGSYTLPRVLCTFLFCVLVAFPQPIAPASGGPMIELTRTDLFASPGWSSKSVSVLGFHLGMTKQEALENADALGIKLTGEGAPNYERPCSASTDCYVEDQRGFPTGITFEFGDKGKLSKLWITRAAEDKRPVRGGPPWVHWRFKGLTYELFSNYSDSLRQKVFGAETTKTIEANTDALTYYYPRLGATLSLSPCLQRSPEPTPKMYCGDITLGFEPPVSP